MSKEKTFNCKHCGKCCVIHTDIPVRKREAKKYGYKTRAFHGKRWKREWRVLARKRAYLQEAGKHVYMCFYFDHHQRLCVIYDTRPKACVDWRCDWKNRVPEEWKRLINGEATSCLNM